MSYRPYRKPGINPIWVIIGVNLVIFIATLINPGQIFGRFALIPKAIVEQPWTLLTYMFVHGRLSVDVFSVFQFDIDSGFYHIFFNMLTLYFFGTFTMALVGETAFLVTYFVGGIVGGLFYLAFSQLLGTTSLVVGASGAVYALGGFLMIMRPKTRVMTFPIPIPMPLWVAILVGFVFVSFIPGVAWEAHLGGLVYGVVVGYYYLRRERRGRY
jgi:membrane associated rhomboid family serine protease